MNVNYHISPYPLLLEDMVAKIYEVNPDGTKSDLAMDIAIPAPHNSPVSVSFNGLDKVTHEVRLYTDPSANLLHRYQIQPTVDTVNVFTPIKFIIGDGNPNTPAAGDTAYINSAMIGLTENQYTAYRNGYGIMFEGVHIINEPTGGGFSLAVPGDVFSGDPAEEWTIQLHNQVVTTPVNDSVVGKQFGATATGPNMYLDVTGAVTYAPAHLRHLIRLAGPSAVYTFGTTDIPPVGYIFRITNFGGGATSPLPKVKFDNAPLLWGGTTKAELEIPRLCAVEFVFDGTSWNVTMMDPTVVAPATTPPAIIKGVVNIGDIPSGTTLLPAISIPNQGNTNYWVGLQIISNGGSDNDTTLILAVDGPTKTNSSFRVRVRQTTGVAQNVSISYVIIQL